MLSAVKDVSPATPLFANIVSILNHRSHMTTPGPRVPRVKKLPVSAINIARAADRLLSQRLVSTEIDYIQRTLGASSR